MKKTILFLMMALSLSIFAQSQGGKKSSEKKETPKKEENKKKNENKAENKGERPNIEQKADKVAQRWQKELSLSDDQREAFRKAKTKQLNQKRTAIENSKGDRQQLGAEMKKINQEFRESIKTSIGDEKYNQWVAKKKEMAKKGKEMKDNKTKQNTEPDPLDEEDDGV